MNEQQAYDLKDQVEETLFKLLDYCRESNWSGYDPYDALNSRLLNYLPFLNFRFPRIALTQFLKRSPVNLRPLLLIPKTQNPKAIALFLMAFVKLSKLGRLDQEDLIEKMTETLKALRSPNTTYWCWGYSFPWQTRTIIVPRSEPNLVCTSFVANALFDVYETKGETICREMAVSAAEYILNELYWMENESVACLRYPLPSSRARVHNANFLGAAVLTRAYKHTGDKKFLEPALKVARYSAGKQHEDGSWDYGEASTQGWVDNFHTGYNLCALKSIGRLAQTTEFELHIRRGFEFYRNNFFRGDGAPKYFHNRMYPIDIHCAAQSIITLIEFKDMDRDNITLSYDVFRWTMSNLFDGRNYFYYQKLPYCTIKIPYMRWTQAWMQLALSSLLEEIMSMSS